MKVLLFLLLSVFVTSENVYGMKEMPRQTPLPPLASQLVAPDSSSYSAFLRFFTKRCVELSKEELIKKLEEKIDWIKTTYCPKYNYSAIDYNYAPVFVNKLDSQHYLHGKYDSGESYPCCQPDSEDQSPFYGEDYNTYSLFHKKINNYSSIEKRQFGLGKDEKMWELDELIADVTPLILFLW